MSHTDLTEYGYNSQTALLWQEHGAEGFEPGRVLAEHRERYRVVTARGELDAEITGNLRFTASDRSAFPAVGDWVVLMVYDGATAMIHKILPRTSLLSRQAVGRQGEVQVIAANINLAFLVQSADRDFNINRLERYLTICHSSGIRPVIVLTKTDLLSPAEVPELLNRLERRISQVPVLAVSNVSGEGLDLLAGYLQKGLTCCLLGSSGAGKSTLLNRLSGREVMKTDSISASTLKGRHTTTHRELIVLESGALLIDNPGMKEVGIADQGEGLDITFDQLLRLAGSCRYQNCTHTGEAGCAVREAVENGELDSASYENYLRMEREKAHFEATLAERRQKDKEFGKMMKNYKKDLKKNS